MNCIAGPSRLTLPRSPVLWRCASTAAQYTRPGGSREPLDKPFRPIQQQILKAAAQGHEWPNWKVPKDHRKGKNDSLVVLGDSVVELDDGARRVERLSIDGARFTELGSDALQEGFEPLDEPDIEAMTVGSVIEIRRTGRHYIGVIIGYQVHSGRAFIRTLTTVGEVLGHLMTDIFFVVPSYFPREIISRGGTGDTATNPREESARIAMVKRLRELTKDIEQTLARISARADNLYDAFRPKDPAAWGQISAVDAARFVDQTKPEEAPHTRTVFAVHKYMFDQELFFVADPIKHRISQTYELRPANDVAILSQVADWVRRDDAVIAAFAAKAKHIIKTYRSLRKDSGALERIPVSLPAFTQADLSIIAFMRIYADRRRFLQVDPTATSVSIIMKKIGTYDGDITTIVVFRLLQEIGVYTPWEDTTTAGRPLVQLKNTVEQQVREERHAEALIKVHQHSSSVIRSGSLGPEEFYTSDPAASLRHDFGTLTAYVIDESTAMELDDGVSVEPVAGSPGEVWVHVHVADPTASLHPGHVFAKEARERVVTAYLAERTWPMLPRALTQHQMSLDSGEGRPTNVLTFSARVTPSGEVSQSLVRPGIIRNVRKLTYDEVSGLLGLQPIPFSHTPLFQISPSSENESRLTQLRNDRDFPIDNLRLLFETYKRLRGHRFLREFLVFHKPRPVVKLTPGQLPGNPVEPTTPHLWHGFPRIELQPTRLFDLSKDMVAELMILANKVAAIFCIQRGIPTLYRGSPTPLVPSPTGIVEALSMRDSNGLLSDVQVAQLGLIMMAGGSSVKPVRHYMLGLSEKEGYTRVTSPLRRYSDLVAHWQIKSALLDPSLSSLPFTDHDLQKIAVHVDTRTKALTRLEGANIRFWSCLLIKRIMDTPLDLDKRAALHHLPAQVIGEQRLDLATGRQFKAVRLLSLGLDATLRGLTKENMTTLPVGTMLTVKVVEVELDYVSKLYVEKT